MLKAIGLVAIVLVVLVVALLIYASTRPDRFRIERSTLIQAPAGKIAGILGDFRRWKEWSPWETRDPALQRTLSGPATGKGAVYEWQGNKDVGRGRMEILDLSDALVRIKLDFFSPFEAHNTAEYVLQPEGGGTRVTWAMFGPSPLMSKVVGVFMNMDRMVGKDFETGLANLKSISEK
jgi:hypothetical protein